MKKIHTTGWYIHSVYASRTLASPHYDINMQDGFDCIL